jgi:hypothetical protein
MGVVRVIMAVLILTTPAFAEERITLTAFRDLRVGFAPLTVELKIIVPRRPENRMVCLIFHSDRGMAGESCYQYDGDTMYARPYTLRELSEGEYAVKAWLYAAETNDKGEKVVKEYPSNLLTISARGSGDEP